MKAKQLVHILYALFALVLVSGIASAALTIDFVSPPTNVNHSTDVNLRFRVSLTDAITSDVPIDITLSTSVGSFKNPPTRVTLTVADQIKEVPLVLSIPKHVSGAVVVRVSGSVGGIVSGQREHTLQILPVNNLSVSKTKDLTRTQDGSVKIMNEGNTRIEEISVISTGAFNVVLTPSGTIILNAGESQTVSVSAGDISNLKFGDNIVTISARGKVGTQDVTSSSASMNIPNTFCRAGSQGSGLSIEDVDIENTGEGDDDKWKLLDVVEVTVDVENVGNDDIEDIIVELGLFDNDGKNVADDLDFENSEEEEIELGDLDEDDDESAVFRFLVPADMEEGDYKVAVKAFSDDAGEATLCTDRFDGKASDDVSIDREDDEGKFIAFDNIVLTPSEATCGDHVTLTADVVNIGDEDQEQVKVNLASQELRVDTSTEIRNDLDQGDEESITLEFDVPQNVDDKNYQLRLSSDYDYRRGSYQESSEEDRLVPLKVFGCVSRPGGPGPSVPGTGSQNIVSISAALDSDAVPGSELTVKATVTNIKSESANLVISALDYQSWASASRIMVDNRVNRIITLGPGASKEVTFEFDVLPDAAGDQSFDIEIRVGEETQTKTVSGISFEARESGGGFDLNFKDNRYIWIIGIVNVVLVILIIIIAVRVSQR